MMGEGLRQPRLDCAAGGPPLVVPAGPDFQARTPRHNQARSRPPVSSSIVTAQSEMMTHAIMYQAGAIVLPVTLISHATTSCAVPPNTDTATAYALAR